ncbi:MAG TPA: hypothetical protein VFC78_00185 [Tepidisphaeraceae bacterium]|nr:hypothetical protein [Tepidisphaeraceae bacterium]
MDEANFANAPDGGALRTLPGGLVIVRRKKHEWIESVHKMRHEKLRVFTDKVFGSKFVRAWDLARVTNWIEEQALAVNWTRELQEPKSIVVRLPEIVGVADGERVHTIRMVCDVRYLHAYPVED